MVDGEKQGLRRKLIVKAAVARAHTSEAALVTALHTPPAQGARNAPSRSSSLSSKRGRSTRLTRQFYGHAVICSALSGVSPDVAVAILARKSTHFLHLRAGRFEGRRRIVKTQVVQSVGLPR